jgi:DNA-binding Lrp family transcriptional regulator
MPVRTAFDRLDATDRRLVDDFQRGLAAGPSPFAAIGRRLGAPEAEVIRRLRALVADGLVARVGAVTRPNTLGASTLAALETPPDGLERVAEAVAAEPGVNHAYLREGRPDLWFVATGPDRAHVALTLRRIAARTGRPVVDLPLVTPYHIDLGFALDGSTRKAAPPPLDMAAVEPGDADVAQALVEGLPLTARPFAELARRLGRSEADVLRRTASLLAAGVIVRLGVIVRHRPLGWRANAMVCFAPREDVIDAAGARLAAAEGVTLCYRRRPDPARWPFPLFCMVHGTTRAAALRLVDEATEAAGLGGVERRVLFSTRCLKQRGALIAEREAPRVAAMAS